MFNLFRPPTKPLPESFLFGVATADHQCEAYDERYPDIQDLWEEKRNLTKREKATDFWNLYQEDIRLAQEMGCKAFRISLAWARLEPNPGQFNEEAFIHYRQLLETIQAAGMEAIVTLHHYTWPIHVEERGGSISPDFPSIFATYADEVAKRLGDLIQYWVTFNEPNQLIYGYFKTAGYKLPPGLPLGTSVEEQMEKVQQLIPNLFEAHTRARVVIKRHYPDAKVGTNSFLLGLPRLSRWFVDWQISHLKEEDWKKQGYRYTEQSFLWQRDVDVVVAMLSVTPQREQQVDFSEIYYLDGLKLLVRADMAIQNHQDLDGKKVAVIKGSTAAESIFKLLPKIEDRVFDDLAGAKTALDRGEVNAILADESFLQNLLRQYPEKYKLVGDRLTEERYAVGVAKGNPLLLDAVDLAVKTFLKKAKSDRLYEQHLSYLIDFPTDLSAVENRRVLANISNPNLLPKASPTTGGLPLAKKGSWLRKIQERGYLIAAVREDVPGFGYRHPETGEYSGLEIDLARTIAQTILGDASKVKFRAVQTKARLPRLTSIFQLLDPILKAFSTLSTIFNSNWWNLGMAGKLPEFLCPANCAHQQDFVGFDYYWGSNFFWPRRLWQLYKAAQGQYTNAPVWEQGLYYLLKDHHRLFPNQEILIVENGCVDEADNTPRMDYIRDHIAQIKRACQEGINVKGYIYWSITSNREWGYKFTPNSDFGLYHIDLDRDPELKRIPTLSVEVYRDIINSW